jgi:hypothetical protein
VDALVTAITDRGEHHNLYPEPFGWTATDQGGDSRKSRPGSCRSP